MLKRPQTTRNYTRDFAIRDLEFEQEAAAQRRKVAQRKRRQALLEVHLEEYINAYW